MKGRHKTISCEFCHGPYADHIKDGKKVGTLPVKRGEEIKVLCLRCHNKAIQARPEEVIKTVVMPEQIAGIRDREWDLAKQNFAFIVSSLYHVFKVEALKPISRFSLLFALAFLAFATLPLLMHLGRPERNFNIMLTPNPSSAMAGFGYIYTLYGIVLLLEILFIYRPTLVKLKEQSQGMMKLIYRVLTFDSDNLSPKSLELDHKIIKVLAAIGIPMACVLHGYVGFIFGGVKANPIWATPLMPVIFLLSACVSGIAGIILVYSLIKKFRNQPVDMVCPRACTNYLAGFFIIDFSFEMLEVFSHSYLRTWYHHSFQHKIGYTWFEIWHHEGRRARMAVAMNAPDYTHWHGMYEISRNFYQEFLPEVQELADHAGKGAKYKKIIQELLDKPENLWIRTGGSAETMKLIEEEQKMRYNQ